MARIAVVNAIPSSSPGLRGDSNPYRGSFATLVIY